MALLSSLCNCFAPSPSSPSSSPRVSDNKKKVATDDKKKSKCKSSKSSEAPIVVPNFPVNSNPSRL
ncbi:hypothetical protein TIFTF001_024438 [Ficus carica]|uniref:Uncharacterized protein n=1 Tax=Ficus carica TaxID=3494 RepID=A0AA88DGV3_FICCA|nr:hypothetical protein TIFTF001_024438 [Ficus carica]